MLRWLGGVSLESPSSSTKLSFEDEAAKMDVGTTIIITLGLRYRKLQKQPCLLLASLFYTRLATLLVSHEQCYTLRQQRNAFLTSPPRNRRQTNENGSSNQDKLEIWWRFLTFVSQLLPNFLCLPFRTGKIVMLLQAAGGLEVWPKCHSVMQHQDMKHNDSVQIGC